jgi:hypothetical protein
MKPLPAFLQGLLFKKRVEIMLVGGPRRPNTYGFSILQNRLSFPLYRIVLRSVTHVPYYAMKNSDEIACSL